MDKIVSCFVNETRMIILTNERDKRRTHKRLFNIYLTLSITCA